MALASAIKYLVKPPFANYDVVVYFGGGLFALPLINHYFIEPSRYRFPRFSFDIGVSFANEAVSLLSLLFSVYILGHIIAFCGSLIVEKTIDVFNGKVSSAILISAYSKDDTREKVVSAWILGRWRDAFKKGQRFQNAVRFAAHVPMLPLYLIIDLTGGADYYRSRVPKHIIFLARRKLKAAGHGPMSLDHPWYKTLEHVVINNNPSATSRMYNYLVISGLFRSLSFMFLACVWAEYYYLIHEWADGHVFVKPLLSDTPSIHASVFGLAILYVIFGFCWSSYMKFQRRYAEEAIFAYVLSD